MSGVKSEPGAIAFEHSIENKLSEQGVVAAAPTDNQLEGMNLSDPQKPVTGIKLVLIVGSVALACFLMLLDRWLSAHYAPLEKRPALIGLTMGLNQLGLVAGPLVGGAFTSYVSWRWCFYVNLPIGAFTALVLVLLKVPEQRFKNSALVVLPKLHLYLDLVGFALFAPAVLQLLLALQYGGNQYAWNSSRVIGLFAILDTSAILSGVYLLPTILPQLFAAALSGALLQKIGFVIPFAIVGTILLAVGSGLYSLLQPASPTGDWVGFQILSGVGSGLSLQLAIITVQAAVGDDQLATGMAFIIFAQSLGPAIVLAICNVIFDASLMSQLSSRAPNVDVEDVICAGATGFRHIASPGDLPGILAAYSNSIDRVFYFVAAIASACSLVLWGIGWQDLRKTKDAQACDEEGSQVACSEKS